MYESVFSYSLVALATMAVFIVLGVGTMHDMPVPLRGSSLLHAFPYLGARSS